jgi:hypothetical protein
MLVPASVNAGGTSVLVGAQTVSFGADLSKYYDISPGPGITLLAAFDVGIPMDFRVGRRTADEGNTGGDVTYQWIELGPRFPLGVEGTSIQPDWFFGIGSYDLEIGDLEFDTAMGGYLGMGVEETLSERYLGRIEAKAVFWKSDTFNTDGPSLNLSLLFGVNF